MKLLKIINPKNATEAEISQYRVRKAARAIVIDSENNIALLYVSKYKYYKLPGGGIDDGEKKEEALKRECLEEVGCDIKLLGEIGKIIEHRKMYQVEQISYCYVARVEGKKGKPNLTKKEISEGFKQLWVSYDEAVKLLSENKAIDLEGKSYIVPRDAIFIKAAKSGIIK